MAVFLDPIETGGWLGVLRSNGVKKAYAFGQYVGRRYKRFANIVWWHGNDFQTWRNPRRRCRCARGGARYSSRLTPRHLQTVLLDYLHSGSLDDPRWRPLIKLNAAYTYLPTYAEVLKEYNRKNHLPVFMGEAGYEFEQNIKDISPGNPDILRRQEYWSILSGACGQFYGNHYTWQFAEGWKQHLDTPGSVQVRISREALQRSTVVSARAGPDDTRWSLLGTASSRSDGNVASSSYVTTAATPDGRLAISYLPAGGAITVDMSRFAGSVDAQWYDPSKGTYSVVSGSPFRNSGSVRVSTPGANADGDPDWVLVLRAG